MGRKQSLFQATTGTGRTVGVAPTKRDLAMLRQIVRWRYADTTSLVIRDLLAQGVELQGEPFARKPVRGAHFATVDHLTRRLSRLANVADTGNGLAPMLSRIPMHVGGAAFTATTTGARWAGLRGWVSRTQTPLPHQITAQLCAVQIAATFEASRWRVASDREQHRGTFIDGTPLPTSTTTTIKRGEKVRAVRPDFALFWGESRHFIGAFLAFDKYASRGDYQRIHDAVALADGMAAALILTPHELAASRAHRVDSAASVVRVHLGGAGWALVDDSELAPTIDRLNLASGLK